MDFRQFFSFFRGTRKEEGPTDYKQVEDQCMRLYGVPSAEKFDLTKPPVALTQRQLRALATGGLLLSAWWLSLKQIMPVLPEVHRDITRMLKQDWGINSPKQLEKMMRRLLEKGHRSDLQVELEQNTAHWRAKFDEHPFLRPLPVHSVTGWDVGRVVCLAYWGLLAGMLDQETAFANMQEATVLAQKDLHSWADLAASYLAGLIMWDPDHVEDLPFFSEYAQMLLEHEQSVWRLLPWSGHLAATAPQA